VLLNVAEQKYLPTTLAQLQSVHEHGLHDSRWNVSMLSGQTPLDSSELTWFGHILKGDAVGWRIGYAG
jgi:hypothetical protein